MKILLYLLGLCSLNIVVYSQDFENYNKNEVVYSTFSTRGYIGGIRLDSVAGTYAEFTRIYKGILFNYGQPVKEKENLKITNVAGKPLMITGDTIAALLNFFDYNGWLLAYTYHEPRGYTETFILKKK